MYIITTICNLQWGDKTGDLAIVRLCSKVVFWKVCNTVIIISNRFQWGDKTNDLAIARFIRALRQNERCAENRKRFEM